MAGDRGRDGGVVRAPGRGGELIEWRSPAELLEHALGCERLWLEPYAAALRERGGTAGLLAGDLPAELAEAADVRTADAYVLSLDNALVE